MATTSQRPKASLDVSHDAHSNALLQGLQELRSENMLVDVTLCVSGKEIPCHRNVLAACSGYFRAMFCNGHLESKENKVTIHEASANIVQLLVDYAYTSKVTVTEDNAVELMEGASFFQFEPVRDACTKFLSDTLWITNCLERINVGNMLMNRYLESSALSYVMKEFTAVTQTPEFLDLTKEQLIKLISSDELNAPEEAVYTSVLKWIKHAPRKRKKEMRELMELVRFPWMDKMYFIENVQTDKALCKCCPDVVSEAQKYQAFPGEIQSPRTRPRRASGLREAVVVIGGTEKYAIGENPSVESNSIVMTHSSAPSSTSWVSMGRIKRANDFGFAVAVLGTSDIMVSVGGTQCKNVWLYQAGLDSWSRLADMNTARDFHKLAVVQGKAYAIGGRISYSPLHVTTNVEVYDRSLNKWTEGVPLTQPRYQHAVAVVDGSIYVMGGRDADDLATSTVFLLSPGDCQWHSASDMPNKANDITASVLNGVIYVAGIPSNMLCYSHQEDLWTVVANTGTGYRCGMTVFGGEIYIYGGYKNENATTKVLRFNQQDKSLQQVGTMPNDKGLFGHGCVTILKS
ncbi:kelch-like protein 24 [Branchiostoma floridae]|uniref:Kelch-like protein 24 n=1 Tax=Branchiostoma floridae TaxID=7739 RepID=A0A9J7MND9_BRAFL|nr:kelch-like protein 24 [Branchiostoma floridae]